MSERPIVKSIEYSAVPNGREVELRVRRTLIEFVRETIPDGQMAGMPGHRPIEHVQEFTFSMPAGQARALYEDLGRALADRP